MTGKTTKRLLKCKWKKLQERFKKRFYSFLSHKMEFSFSLSLLLFCLLHNGDKLFNTENTEVLINKLIWFWFVFFTAANMRCSSLGCHRPFLLCARSSDGQSNRRNIARMQWLMQALKFAKSQQRSLLWASKEKMWILF